jgi:aspartate carbamoyltransferase catalytic subunit
MKQRGTVPHDGIASLRVATFRVWVGLISAGNGKQHPVGRLLDLMNINYRFDDVVDCSRRWFAHIGAVIWSG